MTFLEDDMNPSYAAALAMQQAKKAANDLAEKRKPAFPSMSRIRSRKQSLRAPRPVLEMNPQMTRVRPFSRSKKDCTPDLGPEPTVPRRPLRANIKQEGNLPGKQYRSPLDEPLFIGGAKREEASKPKDDGLLPIRFDKRSNGSSKSTPIPTSTSHHRPTESGNMGGLMASLARRVSFSRNRSNATAPAKYVHVAKPPSNVETGTSRKVDLYSEKLPDTRSTDKSNACEDVTASKDEDRTVCKHLIQLKRLQRARRALRRNETFADSEGKRNQDLTKSKGPALERKQRNRSRKRNGLGKLLKSAFSSSSDSSTAYTYEGSFFSSSEDGYISTDSPKSIISGLSDQDLDLTFIDSVSVPASPCGQIQSLMGESNNDKYTSESKKDRQSDVLIHATSTNEDDSDVEVILLESRSSQSAEGVFTPTLFEEDLSISSQLDVPAKHTNQRSPFNGGSCWSIGGQIAQSESIPHSGCDIGGVALGPLVSGRFPIIENLDTMDGEESVADKNQQGLANLSSVTDGQYEEIYADNSLDMPAYVRDGVAKCDHMLSLVWSQ